VAERVIYRFGAEKGKPAGPDRATTTVAEDMQFKVSAGGQKVSRAVGVSCSSHAFSNDKSRSWINELPFARLSRSKTKAPSSRPSSEARRSPVVSVRETISRRSVPSKTLSRVLVWATCWLVGNLLWTTRLHRLRPWPALPADRNTFLREFPPGSTSCMYYR
jgi:hypothetical protein